jgi:hypothetical protein
VGNRVSLHTVKGIVLPVARHCTDWAILTPEGEYKNKFSAEIQTQQTDKASAQYHRYISKETVLKSAIAHYNTST